MILGDALCSRLLLLLGGIEGSDELLDVTPSLNATELLLRLDDCSTDPADDHPAALPTLHVPRVRHDPAVQVLDGVRGSQFPVERAPDAEPLERERLVESFKDRSSGSGMLGFEGGGQTFESPLRDLRIAENPSFLQNGLHALVKMIWKVTQDVATLVDLAALDLGQRAEHLSDRRAERLGPIDHEESS